jgi:hypothetical protein
MRLRPLSDDLDGIRSSISSITSVVRVVLERAEALDVSHGRADPQLGQPPPWVRQIDTPHLGNVIKRSPKRGIFAQVDMAVVEDATSETLAADPYGGKDPAAVGTGGVAGKGPRRRGPRD